MGARLSGATLLFNEREIQREVAKKKKKKGGKGRGKEEEEEGKRKIGRSDY